MISEDGKVSYDRVSAIVSNEIDAQVGARQQTLEEMKGRMDLLMKEVSCLSKQIQIAQEQRQIESKQSLPSVLEPVQGDGTLEIKTSKHTTTFGTLSCNFS